MFTWGSRPCSSCTAALKQGRRHVLVGEVEGSTAPAQVGGREQQQLLWAGQVEWGRRSRMVVINLKKEEGT